jgi:hypothetical protein
MIRLLKTKDVAQRIRIATVNRPYRIAFHPIQHFRRGQLNWYPFNVDRIGLDIIERVRITQSSQQIDSDVAFRGAVSDYRVGAARVR